MTDFAIENHGSIVLLQPMTDDAAQWIEDTRPEESQLWGRALVIEPRYVGGVVDVAQADGFSVS